MPSPRQLDHISLRVVLHELDFTGVGRAVRLADGLRAKTIVDSRKVNWHDIHCRLLVFTLGDLSVRHLREGKVP